MGGVLEQAEALHKESLALSSDLGAHAHLTLTLLEGLACGAGARGEAQKAARLFRAVIRKNGIKLHGDDAVIEPPARPDSPCSRTFGPGAICVPGDVNIETGELTGQRVSDVSVSGFTIRGFEIAGKGDSSAFMIDLIAARNATVVGNRVIGNVAGGIVAFSNVDTTVAKNHVTASPETDAEGILVEASSRTTVVKNVVKRYPQGHNAIEVAEGIDTTIAGNDLIGNWVGVFVIDSSGTKILFIDMSRSGIVGTFMAGPKPANAKVVGNNISSGARDMEVTANRLSGNVPSGPTAVSGGVVVSTDPFGGGTAKPTNNNVSGNHFGRNKPDISWDEFGSGNRFVNNDCNTSVPSRLCN